MLKSKVTTCGSSTVLALPKPVLSKLRVKTGDTVCFIETPNGFEIVPCDPEFEEEMDAARSVMRRYPNALRDLSQ